MDDFQYLSRLHKAIRKASEARPLDTELSALEKETWRRLLLDTPLVFACPAPGFLLIGLEGCELSVPHPELHEGIEDAGTIFTYGASVGAFLDAAYFVGRTSRTPGTTLQKRLDKAAEWADRLPCPELWKEIKAIHVSRAGAITYTPTGRQIKISV